MLEEKSTRSHEAETAKAAAPNKQRDVRKRDASDIRKEAQKIADAMVAKKLKNMPSKQEAAEWKEIKANARVKAEELAEAEKALKEATRRAALMQREAEATILAAKAGIAPDYLEDAVILALARTGGEGDLARAINYVVERIPQWRVNTRSTASESRTKMMDSEGGSEASETGDSE